jgi:ribosomal protein S7
MNKNKIINISLYLRKFYFFKFINLLLKKGKKGNALKLFYKILNELFLDIGLDPYNILHHAIKNAKSLIFLKKRNIAGIAYEIPIILFKNILLIILRKILYFSMERFENKFYLKISNEILEAFNNMGFCIRLKERTYIKLLENRNFRRFLGSKFKKKKKKKI